jgi:peptide/nickel transport system permease protein
VIIGVFADLFGSWIDLLLSNVIEVWLLSDIFMALVILSSRRQHYQSDDRHCMFTLNFARIARGAVLEIKGALLLKSPVQLAVNKWNSIKRHILPNILAPLIVQTTLSLGFCHPVGSGVEFLGLGVEPDTLPGAILLNEGKDWMDMAWWLAVFPGEPLPWPCVSFILMGDGLRDALDPKMRNLNE